MNLEPPPNDALAGIRVAFVGRLGSLTRREAQQLVRRSGGGVAESAEQGADWVVLGAEEWPLADRPADLLTRETLDRAGRGELEILSETQFWQRLGLVEADGGVRRLYTPAMLAELLGVPVGVIRRWHRRRLIVPVREVHRLPYFDFQEVATARRLAQLLAAGASPQAIERKLAELARFLPEVERPLAQLSVIVEGKQILLRQGEGLIEPSGQLRFDFEAAESAREEEAPVLPFRGGTAEVLRGELLPLSVEEILAVAGECDDAGDSAGAAELYRTALAIGGPRAETCFQLAEVLYRLGETGAARERYYMTLELDEEYVEARVNLGCVLAELGEFELAAAAFTGALAHHEDFPDAHFHLARVLDRLERSEEADPHWRRFLGLAPQSPWAEEARDRLGWE